MIPSAAAHGTEADPPPATLEPRMAAQSIVADGQMPDCCHCPGSKGMASGGMETDHQDINNDCLCNEDFFSLGDHHPF